MTDAANGCSAHLSHAFSHHVDGIEYCFCLFIEQQVIIPEMGTVEMPVKVLCLYVKSKGICDEWIDCLCYSLKLFGGQIQSA